MSTLRLVRGFASGLVLMSMLLVPLVSRAQYPGCTPSFPRKTAINADNLSDQPLDWLGGDIAVSTPFTAQTSIWGFSDCVLNNPGSTNRYATTQGGTGKPVANMIGLATCQNSTFNINYYYRGTSNNPLPIFTDPRPFLYQGIAVPTRLWVDDVIVVNGYLYAFLRRVASFPEIESYIGSYLARVRNPSSPINQWQIDYFILYDDPYTRDHYGFWIGLSSFYYNGYIYTYCRWLTEGGGGEFWSESPFERRRKPQPTEREQYSEQRSISLHRCPTVPCFQKWHTRGRCPADHHSKLGWVLGKV